MTAGAGCPSCRPCGVVGTAKRAAALAAPSLQPCGPVSSPATRTCAAAVARRCGRRRRTLAHDDGPGSRLHGVAGVSQLTRGVKNVPHERCERGDAVIASMSDMPLSAPRLPTSEPLRPRWRELDLHMGTPGQRLHATHRGNSSPRRLQFTRTCCDYEIEFLRTAAHGCCRYRCPTRHLSSQLDRGSAAAARHALTPQRVVHPFHRRLATRHATPRGPR
jgi:hypothetical protein